MLKSPPRTPYDQGVTSNHCPMKNQRPVLPFRIPAARKSHRPGILRLVCHFLGDVLVNAKPEGIAAPCPSIIRFGFREFSVEPVGDGLWRCLLEGSSATGAFPAIRTPILRRSKSPSLAGSHVPTSKSS